MYFFLVLLSFFLLQQTYEKTKKKLNRDLWASHIEIMALTQLYDFLVKYCRSYNKQDRRYLLPSKARLDKAAWKPIHWSFHYTN